MSDKTTDKAQDKKIPAMDAAEHVAKSVLGAATTEMNRFIDEVQKTQERMFIESERMMGEQQKLFDTSLKMSRAMGSAFLESARRMTGSVN